MRLASFAELRAASFILRAPIRHAAIFNFSRRKREPFALQRSIHFGLIRLAQRLWCGRERKVACDALVLAHPPAPAFELARQAGALTLFDPRCGFRVDTNPNGATAAPGVFVAGEALGPASPLQAVESGQRAAAEIAEGLA